MKLSRPFGIFRVADWSDSGIWKSVSELFNLSASAKVCWNHEVGLLRPLLKSFVWRREMPDRKLTS